MTAANVAWDNVIIAVASLIFITSLTAILTGIFRRRENNKLKRERNKLKAHYPSDSN